MQTAEIVKALRWCGTGTEDGCTNCAFEPICDEDAVTCDANLCDAAADRLEELLDRCARYAEEIAVLRERQRWVPVTERLPETENFVLAVVNGKPTENITLVDSIEIASFMRDEGWFLDMYPEWEDPKVSCWMPLPSAPEVEL